MSDALMTTYSRLPVSFVRGQGAWLWDDAGNKYLDAISGIAVCGLGHAHPAVTQALVTQAGQLLHTSNLYRIRNQEELGARLCQVSGMERAFFCNSGAEANEAAIKLARLHGHHRGFQVPTIVVTEGSFHGRTLATLSATGNRKIHAGFEPLVQGFLRVDYGDFEAIRKLADHHSEICAILVEPVQGEGGVRIPPAGYLHHLREWCDRHQWLLMVDEVQTGMGRTGRWFGVQHEGVLPDVMTLAKGLGNGVPIGCCLAHGGAATLFAPGNHGSTFGGGPLACAAALAVVDTIHSEHLEQRAAVLGAGLLEQFRQRLARVPGVLEVRGRGLMLGIELEHDCPRLVQTALEHGLLINVTAGRVIRLLPPLVLTDQDADWLATTLSSLIIDFLSPLAG